MKLDVAMQTLLDEFREYKPKVALTEDSERILTFFEALDFTNEGCTSWKLFKVALQSAHGNTLNKSQITRLYRSYTENVGLPLSTIHFSKQQSLEALK